MVEKLNDYIFKLECNKEEEECWRVARGATREMHSLLFTMMALCAPQKFESKA
jgi:hypothetical protein